MLSSSGCNATLIHISNAYMCIYILFLIVVPINDIRDSASILVQFQSDCYLMHLMHQTVVPINKGAQYNDKSGANKCQLNSSCFEYNIRMQCGACKSSQTSLICMLRCRVSQSCSANKKVQIFIRYMISLIS